MKRWIHWASLIYPPEWRLRYGGEFDALLDDARLQWSDVADVFRGAVKMRMSLTMSYQKTALLTGIAGALIAGWIAYSMHNDWICNASMVLDSPAVEGSLLQRNSELQKQFQQLQSGILSRDNLIALIENPRLDLYPKERMHHPVAEIAEGTLRKQIRFRFHGTDDGQHALVFGISFRYPDRNKALLVMREIEAELQARNRSVSHLEVAIPQAPTYPFRSVAMLIGPLAGISAGMLLGMLALGIWRRTRRYAVVTLSIPQDGRRFVDSQVAGGSYRNADEYVAALIRADEERQGGLRC